MTTAEWPANVATSAGAVGGRADAFDTVAWRGVPFGRPPVGDLRWRTPQEVEPWGGLRDASNFGPLPWQAGSEGTSEDCLYLNVWRPGHGRSGLPVYVWLPGGANQVQMPSNTVTSGAFLAHHSDVVVVTVSYRVNNLGWFTHEALQTGDPYDDSGNYGTLDIIAALRWIDANIDAFGGDPDNVLVTGESAGAYNTLTLLLSPLAKGLYHKGMAQSGRQDSAPMERALERGERLLAKLLEAEQGSEAAAAASRRGMSPREVAAFLRSRSPEQLAAAARSLPWFAGYRDGTVIHELGFDALLDGSYPNKVPMIVGMNKEESKFQLRRDPALLADRDKYEAVAKAASDWKRATGCDSILRKLRANPDQPATYGYLFLWGWGGGDHPSPMPDPAGWQQGAAHGMDIGFFLHGARGRPGPVYTEQNEPGRRALADAMRGYVAAFAHTGVPTAPTPDLPAWQPWTNEDGGPKLIHFDADLDRARVTMGTDELTPEAVAEANATLPDEVRERAGLVANRRRQ